MSRDLPTNAKIAVYRRGVEKLNRLIKREQEACEHVDEVVKRYDDHDGWSCVVVNYYETRRCLKCGRYADVKTGEGRSH